MLWILMVSLSFPFATPKYTHVMRMIQPVRSMRSVDRQWSASWLMAGSGCSAIRQFGNRCQKRTRRIKPSASPSRASWRWLRCRTQKTQESRAVVKNEQRLTWILLSWTHEFTAWWVVAQRQVLGQAGQSFPQVKSQVVDNEENNEFELLFKNRVRLCK